MNRQSAGAGEDQNLSPQELDSLLGGGSGAPSPTSWWEQDPLLQPLLQRAATLGLPLGTVLLERTSVQHLLRNHPDVSVRRAVYEAGLVPRKQALMQLRAQIATIRCGQFGSGNVLLSLYMHATSTLRYPNALLAVLAMQLLLLQGTVG